MPDFNQLSGQDGFFLMMLFALVFFLGIALLLSLSSKFGDSDKKR